MTQRSEQLKQEAEQSRAQLAETLEELRTRITPGQVLDQFVDYAGDSGAGEFFRNLGRQAANNPLPVTLMGAGLAWLMLARKSSGSGMGRGAMEKGRGLAGEATDTLSRWGSAANETASDLKDRTADKVSRSMGSVRSSASSLGEKGEAMGSSMAGSASEKAGSAYEAMSDKAASAQEAMSDKAVSAYDTVSDKAASTYGAMSDKAASAYGAVSDKTASAYEDASAAAAHAAAVVRERAQAMTQSAGDAGRSFLDFCKEQPLVLAGVGLALGAALGAALPSTKTEDELMGETSDQLKERAQALAAEQYEKTKSVAEHAYEETKKEAEKQNLAGASELAQAGQENAPTAPSHSEEPASGEAEQVAEPWHGER